MVGIALPQLAIDPTGDIEGESDAPLSIGKSSMAKSSAVGEEEDEEEVKRREMVETIQAGSAVLGLTLVQTWRNLDEPRVHRLQLATSKMMDSVVSNMELGARGSNTLGQQVAAHVSTQLQRGDDATTVLFAVTDEHHEQLWLSAAFGPRKGHASAAAFHVDHSPDDLAWKCMKVPHLTLI